VKRYEQGRYGMRPAVDGPWVSHRTARQVQANARKLKEEVQKLVLLVAELGSTIDAADDGVVLGRSPRDILDDTIDMARRLARRKS
jgi:hypothetical protein